jgi:hypothetical protein
VMAFVVSTEMSRTADRDVALGVPA